MTQNFAAIFPGQGSQKLAMLAELGHDHPVVRETFREASDVLSEDLWTICQKGPEDLLNRTDITQPALLTASTAVWRVWLKLGGAQPALVAGHSLGEYSALVASGVLGFQDAVHLVNQRGIYMQEAVQGQAVAMAAVLGLTDEQIGKVCAQVTTDDSQLFGVNYNSPGQVVVAGHQSALDLAMPLFKEVGARRVMPLAVSVPSHCSLMQPAAVKLAALLEKTSFHEPMIPIVQNVDGQQSLGVREIKAKLVDQLCKPVLWTHSIVQIKALDINTLVEFGPNKVLATLVKRIDKTLAGQSAGETTSAIEQQIQQLSE